MDQKYVGLVRVSTDRQGDSGLGLAAGRADLAAFLKAHGGELVAVLEEIESGTNDDIVDRPTLLRALTLCKRHRAHLLVPKVDRLVRSTIVHADIKKSRVPVRFCDDPHADETIIDLKVAIAASEGRAIKLRTKKALSAYKAAGRIGAPTLVKLAEEFKDPDALEQAKRAVAGKLGAALVGSHLTPEGRDKGRAKGNARQGREAMEVYADLLPEVRQMRAAGRSFRQIAAALNEKGEPTRSGRPWSHVQLIRLLDRAGKPDRAPGRA
jgi:DNA invertase Pin-like site-specific DNA recombinase